MGTAIFVFKNYNPEESAFFPKCPSKYVTGYDCPGCGSQRAVHAALNGNLEKAFDYNSLFFFLLPYGLLVGVFEWIPSLRDTSFRRIIINRYVVLGVFAFIVIFTVWRNV
ncbi:MAG: DUF2752 domain-containing protein [Nonlabens sp.]